LICLNDLLHLRRAKNVYSDAIHRVIESLWSEKGQLTELAAAAVVGISVERFRRVFRDVIGVNFRVFRLRIKLEYGRYLLKDESLSVSDVSCELGYATRSKFEVAFKRAFRVTPAKYRLKFSTEKRPLRA